MRASRSLFLHFFQQKRNVFRIFFVPLPTIDVLSETIMSTKAMQQSIADYFKTQPIQRAWLFGSFARGDESPLSDVDILVQFDEGGVSLLKHAAMICELEKILDRPVDIVPEKMLRPRVRENVDRDKKLIYERTR